MRRTLAAAPGVAMLLLAGAGVALGSSDVSSPETIHGVSKLTEGTTLDLSNCKCGLGDEQVGSFALYENGKRSGFSGVECTKHTGFVVCEGVAKLANGQVSFSGVSFGSGDDHVWAITGGTGNYRNARGIVKVHSLNDTTSRFSLELIP